jgi:hypothetical protein
MTSLTEVYNGGAGGANLRRLYLGVALFVVGVAFVLGGIVFATTDLGGTLFGLERYGKRELAGTLGGLGVPAVFVGILAVLPSSRFVKTAAAVGTAIATVGVVLFRAAYPQNWWLADANYTLPVVAVYFLGTVLTFWCLFAGVANFKTRNDPGGTVKLEITQEGETRVVEVEGERFSSMGGLGSLGGLGGVGLLGTDPDGEVDTQTGARSDGGTASSTTPSSADAPGATDDGATLLDDTDDPADPTDRYCGSCAHFRYVRTGDGLQPYCGAHEELMDDMDACPQWERNG